jgi:glycosyltransferase involved in cell wall biosynthesis
VTEREGGWAARRVRLRRRADPLLAIVDIGSAALVCYVAYLLRFEGVIVPEHFLNRYRVISAVVVVVWLVTARSSALYRRAALRPGTSMVPAAFEAAIATGLVAFIVNLVALHGDVSRAWTGLTTLGLMLSGVLSRGALRRLRRMLVPFGVALERYVVVGSGLSARRLFNDLTRAAGAPYVIIDIVDPPSDAAALARLAAQRRVDGMILAADAVSAVGALSRELAGFGIDVFVAPDVGDLDMRVSSIVTFHGTPLLRVAGIAPRRPAVRTTARREPRPSVAILGTRGIPANYGGFETFAERLAVRLADRGAAVTVYCRRRYATGDSEWRGVRLVTLPTIPSKYLDTVVHTLLSVIHLVARSRVRNVVLCNAANGPLLPLLRLTGRRVVMNVDGLEWRRGKWGVAGRGWYRLGEALSVRWASVLVTDAEEVRTYYRVRHDTDSVMVPYGADLLTRGAPLPVELGVRPDRYLLYVSRWERENNPVMVARAHAASAISAQLVMLGQATYDERLAAEVKVAAAANVLLPGPVYGEHYHALQSNARCYIHATEVGGTHPALIEAMGAGNLCLVLDTPENREVAGPDAWYFDNEAGLAELLRRLQALRPAQLRRLQDASRERAERLFSWDSVVDAYARLLGVEDAAKS